MVLKVESLGIHEESYSFGYVVMDKHGTIVEENLFACRAEYYYTNDLTDIVENTLPITHSSARKLRETFWSLWLGWRAKNTVLVTYDGWPSESVFMYRCVEDYRLFRKWTGPSIIIDISSLLLILRNSKYLKDNPVIKNNKNPLEAARCIAKLLMNCLHDKT